MSTTAFILVFFCMEAVNETLRREEKENKKERKIRSARIATY